MATMAIQCCSVMGGKQDRVGGKIRRCAGREN
jgi:hypothetical protein